MAWLPRQRGPNRPATNGSGGNRVEASTGSPVRSGAEQGTSDPGLRRTVPF